MNYDARTYPSLRRKSVVRVNLVRFQLKMTWAKSAAVLPI
jgi:hypothetical protein